MFEVVVGSSGCCRVLGSALCSSNCVFDDRVSVIQLLGDSELMIVLQW